MKKACIFLGLVGLSLSCGADETNQRKLENKLLKLTQKDLEGKTFEGKLQIKSPDHQKNNSLTKAYEQAKLAYQFNANNQVFYQINLGGMTNKSAFTWHLKGDSLTFERMENGQIKTKRYFIQRTSTGLTLDNDEYRSYLTLK
ncbi:hypothetical protein [Spirosoma gilvum]